MAGLVAGSWLLAECSAWSRRTVESWGNFGKVILPDLLHLPRTAFAFGLSAVLVTIILLLERFTIR